MSSFKFRINEEVDRLFEQELKEALESWMEDLREAREDLERAMAEADRALKKRGTRINIEYPLSRGEQLAATCSGTLPGRLSFYRKSEPTLKQRFREEGPIDFGLCIVRLPQDEEDLENEREPSIFRRLLRKIAKVS